MNAEQFTADKARMLAGNTLVEKVDLLLKVIEQRAKDRKRKLRTGWDYNDHLELWNDGGYKGSSEWLEAKAALEKLGFKVSFVYKETQFVDMYTLVEW